MFFCVVVVACCCVFVFAVGPGRKGCRWKEKKRCVIDRTVNSSVSLYSSYIIMNYLSLFTLYISVDHIIYYIVWICGTACMVVAEVHDGETLVLGV